MADFLFIGFLITILIGILGSVIATIWSIGRGIEMLQRTYTPSAPNQTAQRILAWNLIEPGITIPNIIFWYALLSQRFMYHRWSWLPDNTLWLYPLGIVLAAWPMIVLFMIIPLFAHRSADPTVRWAARKTATLGIPRMIITLITYPTIGLGMFIGVPLLFWSLKQIRLWNDELLGQSAGSQAAAIVGGKSGMLVMPVGQTTHPSDFKTLID